MKIAHTVLVSAIFAVATATSVTGLAQAQTGQNKAGDAKSEQAGDMTEGAIRKIDRASGKLTIKHGEIKNLDMPPMTMVFQVKEKSLLDKVKAGDKIEFKAISDNGRLIVTEIQPGK